MNKSSDVKAICCVRDVSKYYPGVIALDKVNFDVYSSEIHGIIGKNGAGKSTVVNILAGFTPRSSGEILINGKSMPINYNPRIAETQSVFLVSQNPMILSERNIIENLFIGYTRKNKNGFVDYKGMRLITEEILNRFNLNLDPEQEMGFLPIDTQKLILLGKGIYVANAKIFMLDEITSSLNIKQEKIMDEILEEMVSQGKAIIFISHHLKEVMKYCTRVTVFRNGNSISTELVEKLNENALANLIVGKELKQSSQCSNTININSKNVVLDVKNFCLPYCNESIDFSLYEHEVLGFVGLEGCGKEELFRYLAGAGGTGKPKSAKISLKGKIVNLTTPKVALKHGIGYLPRNRETEAVLHGISILNNIVFLVFDEIMSRIKLINSKACKQMGEMLVGKLNIKIGDLDDDIDSLSGGNKQKVIIGRVMADNPQIYILNEPTQGIDIEVKQEILKMVREELAASASVIISSESVSEMMDVCDKIIVLYRGEINAIFSREEFSEDAIYRKIQGI